MAVENVLEIPTHLTPFQRELFLLEHSGPVHDAVTLGRRSGFYNISGEIGVGNFCKVKLGTHVLIKERVAVKIVDKLSLDKRTQKMLFREIENMVVLHHPNIIRLFEVIEDEARMHIILEYAPGGELYQKINENGKMEEKTAKKIFAQIASAVTHIHSKKLVHRDIKAENVFFMSPECVKLGDFGFSTVTEVNQSLTTFCGSPPYAAPELFTEPSYIGSFVDIWALGVLLYFITSGCMPFQADSLSKLKQVIILGSFRTFDHMTSPLRHLLSSILKVKPVNRLKMDKLLAHDWLSSEPKCKLYPESNEKLPKLGKKVGIEASSLSLQSLSDEKFRVVQYMQTQLGIPDSEFAKISSKSLSRDSFSKESVLGIYRMLMHRLQNDIALEESSESKNTSNQFKDSGVSLRDYSGSQSFNEIGRNSSSGRSSGFVKGNQNGVEKRKHKSQSAASSKSCSIL